VFVLSGNASADEGLHDALTAQLSGAATPLVFGTAGVAGDLRERVVAARALGTSHGALGVFWLDTSAADDWVVYLLVQSSTKLLVRHVHVEAKGVAAATEAVAVITRESSEGLLTGQMSGMSAVDIPPDDPSIYDEPAPPPKPVPVVPLGAHRGPSIAVLYHGDYLATAVGWQSGVRVAGAYRWGSGIYAGIGYSLLRDATISRSNLTFQVSRSPFDMSVGAAFPLGRWTPGAELRTTIEFLGRENLSTSSTLEATQGETRILVSASPRLRLEYSLTRSLALVVAAGVDVTFNRFSYILRRDSGDSALLEPARVRPSAEAGIVVWP
jgi:hypothetical protein